MCHLAALEIRQFLERAARLHDGVDLVAANALRIAHANKRHATRHVDGKTDCTGGIQGHMQTPGPLRFDLC